MPKPGSLAIVLGSFRCLLVSPRLPRCLQVPSVKFNYHFVDFTVGAPGQSTPQLPGCQIEADGTGWCKVPPTLPQLGTYLPTSDVSCAGASNKPGVSCRAKPTPGTGKVRGTHQLGGGGLWGQFWGRRWVRRVYRRSMDDFCTFSHFQAQGTPLAKKGGGFVPERISSVVRPDRRSAQRSGWSSGALYGTLRSSSSPSATFFVRDRGSCMACLLLLLNSFRRHLPTTSSFPFLVCRADHTHNRSPFLWPRSGDDARSQCKLHMGLE